MLFLRAFMCLNTEGACMMIGLMGGIRGRMRSILSSSVIPAPEAHVCLLLLLRAFCTRCALSVLAARRYIESFPPLRIQLSVGSASSALERSSWSSRLRGGVHDNYLAVVLSVYVHGERSARRPWGFQDGQFRKRVSEFCAV